MLFGNETKQRGGRAETPTERTTATTRKDDDGRGWSDHGLRRTSESQANLSRKLQKILIDLVAKNEDELVSRASFAQMEQFVHCNDAFFANSLEAAKLEVREMGLRELARRAYLSEISYEENFNCLSIEESLPIAQEIFRDSNLNDGVMTYFFFQLESLFKKGGETGLILTSFGNDAAELIAKSLSLLTIFYQNLQTYLNAKIVFNSIIRGVNCLHFQNLILKTDNQSNCLLKLLKGKKGHLIHTPFQINYPLVFVSAQRLGQLMPEKWTNVQKRSFEMEIHNCSMIYELGQSPRMYGERSNGKCLHPGIYHILIDQSMKYLPTTKLQLPSITELFFDKREKEKEKEEEKNKEKEWRRRKWQSDIQKEEEEENEKEKKKKDQETKEKVNIFFPTRQPRPNSIKWLGLGSLDYTDEKDREEETKEREKSVTTTATRVAPAMAAAAAKPQHRPRAIKIVRDSMDSSGELSPSDIQAALDDVDGKPGSNLSLADKIREAMTEAYNKPITSNNNNIQSISGSLEHKMAKDKDRLARRSRRLMEEEEEGKKIAYEGMPPLENVAEEEEDVVQEVPKICLSCKKQVLVDCLCNMSSGF